MPLWGKQGGDFYSCFAEKETGSDWTGALPKAMQPEAAKPTTNPDSLKHSTLRVCSSHFQRLWRFRACFILFQKWIWQKNKTVQLILAAAAGNFTTPAFCWIWNLKQSSVERRQRKLPFAFHFGSPLDFIKRKETGNPHLCHCHSHLSYAMPLENLASFVMKNNFIFFMEQGIFLEPMTKVQQHSTQPTLYLQGNRKRVKILYVNSLVAEILSKY